ncbi:hypothetical protein NHQ30_009986 [Ciborinia camelliae]|nr:hypothetical protein NHQ30_009986 [Ciborinia camelliae]
MSLSRLFQNRHLRVCKQQKRSIQLSSAPRSPTVTGSIAAMPSPCSMLYTEVPIAKLCDTLWMEKNIVGYKGAKREDILRDVLKKKEEEKKNAHLLNNVMEKYI